MSENGFDETLQVVSERLIQFAKERGVVGQPIEMGDTVILPLSEIRLGFGGGGGEGIGEGEGVNDIAGKGTGIGGLGGGGVKVTPVAVAVVKDGTITLEAFLEGGV